MSGHPIFVRVDRDSVHREFMGGAEDANCNFLDMKRDGIICVEFVIRSYPAICDEYFCQGPAVTSRLASHSLDGVHGRARYTWRCSKDRCEPRGVKGRHGWGPMRKRSRRATGLYIRLGGVNPIGRCDYMRLGKNNDYGNG